MHPPRRPWRVPALLSALVAASVLATTTVTVESGDTLSAIAAAHDVTVAELVEWNDLADPDRILAGSTLVVAEPTNSAGAPGTTSGPTARSYTIRPGETLGGIAARFGITTARLVELNSINDPDRIYAGRRLVIAADSVAAPPTPATARSVSDTSYTVVAGDTLGAIAARFGVRAGVLAVRNGIADPDLIRVGQVLAVDSTGTAVPTTTPAPTATEPPATTTTTVTAPPRSATSAATGSGAVLLTGLFARWANAYDVPRDLLEAIAWKESDWRPDAVGADGRLGIGQLSPETIEFVESGLLGRQMDPLDASDGLQMAARYLRYLLDRTHNEREALAAWNQGLRAVQNQGISAAGGAYADSVLEIRRQRR